MNVIFVWIVGTLLHFTHDWFPNSVVFKVISAVNESTWEHLKLEFFPMLFVTVVGYCYIVRFVVWFRYVVIEII